VHVTIKVSLEAIGQPLETSKSKARSYRASSRVPVSGLYANLPDTVDHLIDGAA